MNIDNKLRGGGTYIRKPLLCLEFFATVICISRKRNGIRKKKQCYCSKMPLYYLTSNKTLAAFQNLGLLCSLRSKTLKEER